MQYAAQQFVAHIKTPTDMGPASCTSKTSDESIENNLPSMDTHSNTEYHKQCCLISTWSKPLRHASEIMMFALGAAYQHTSETCTCM